jgi:fructan beta-fructosidase
MCFICTLFACKTHQNLKTAASEPHRPKFHFTPQANWMNDPNGMVYYEGEYHLFYQYYPNATVWGPMHWGHAVSRDLVNWEHLPIALYPDSLGLIFSGSAVVDWNNSSGFSQNGKPPLVAIFTQHSMEKEKAGRSDFQYQSLAYSNDKGRTWTKYKNNPIIPNTLKIRDFRDPKVVWDEDSKQWVMVFAAHDHIKIWTSKDLKNWQHQSDFGREWGTHAGVWECPDLFKIKVDGTGESKWVLLQSLNPGSPNGGSGTQYFVGNFDGKNFTLDPSFASSVQNGKAIWLDYGRDNYAGVTWSDIPKKDGRRIFMGWMSNWDYATLVPTQVWRSAMTIPRSLNLQNTPNGFRLISQPVTELKSLRKNTYSIEKQAINGLKDLTTGTSLKDATIELELQFEMPAAPVTQIGVQLSNALGETYSIGYDLVRQAFFSDRSKSGNLAFSDKFGAKVDVAPRQSNDKVIRMHLFIDRASCEMFADEGAAVMTDIFFPTEDFNKVQLFSKGGSVKLIAGNLYNL